MKGKTQRFWEITALISVELLISLILFAGAIAILVFCTRRYMRKYKPIDMAIFDKLEPLTNKRNNRLMLFITFLGKHQFLIPANLLLLFYFLFIHPERWFSIRVVAIALSSLVLMIILKQLFRRKRPLAPLLQAVKGLSFPSGHAIMAVTFYGLIIYIILHTITNKWVCAGLITALALLIILIGFSRVYLRVHYASDVVAGFIIGLLWLFISMAVLSRIEGSLPTFTFRLEQPGQKLPGIANISIVKDEITLKEVY